MNKAIAINDYSSRSYVIGGYRVRVNVGCQKTQSMKDLATKNTVQNKVLKGKTVSGFRVQWSNLYRVAMIKKLALRDGLQCNNPDCLTRHHTKEYIKKYGIDWLQIDHIDNNHNNNNIENYQLLCNMCNFLKIKYSI